MSLSISTRYGSRANDPTLDYPTGSFKNKTAPDAVDGTPLEKDWANDLLGARDAILAEAGILANGVADTAQASQLLAALQTLGLRAATETEAGVLEIATTAEAQALMDDMRALTPAKLAAALDVTALGRNQTWQNVTASRAFDITYTNTTGRPIVVQIYCVGNGSNRLSFALTVDGISVASTAGENASSVANEVHTLSAIVPDGSTYSASNGAASTLQTWAELR